jgi:phage FluMu gp28-like protein
MVASDKRRPLAPHARPDSEPKTTLTTSCAESQHQRFIKTARALSADEDEAAFKAKLAVIARQKPNIKEKETMGTSDTDHSSDPSEGMPDEAFERGLKAYSKGLDLSDNPYTEGESEHHEWMTGWYTASKR